MGWGELIRIVREPYKGWQKNGRPHVVLSRGQSRRKKTKRIGYPVGKAGES